MCVCACVCVCVCVCMCVCVCVCVQRDNTRKETLISEKWERQSRRKIKRENEKE